MVASVKSLTKEWIQYLKSNKIVSLQSDPKSGLLKYQREVTSDDLIEFLLVKTDYSEEEIESTIRAVKGGAGAAAGRELAAPDQSSERGVSDWMQNGTSPIDGDPREFDNYDEQPALTNEPRKIGHSPGKLKHDPDSVSDVDFREVPNKPESPRSLPSPKPKEDEKRKPRFRNLKPKLKEDIRDDAGEKISERDVEAIFTKLAKGAADKETQDAEAANKEKKATNTTSGAEMQAKKEDDLRKMKRLIRDIMTDSQRKSLWRMLNEKD